MAIAAITPMIIVQGFVGVIVELDWIILGAIFAAIGSTIVIYFREKAQEQGEKSKDDEDFEQIRKTMTLKDGPKEKVGIIFSDLEGTLTEEVSFWEKLNLEMGMSKEEDKNLYDLFMDENRSNPDAAYSNWMNRIFTLWKKYSGDKPHKFNKTFIEQFCKNHLKLKEGAKEFIQHHKEKFAFFVISGAPGEFCELAKEELGFDEFYSTNILKFDGDGKLIKINGDPYGFRKEEIINRITKQLGVDWEQIIAIGDSENDFTMLNQVGKGILVGMHLTHPDYKERLRSEVVQFDDVDYQKISEVIDEYLSDISIHVHYKGKKSGEDDELVKERKKNLQNFIRGKSNEESLIIPRIIKVVSSSIEQQRKVPYQILDLGSGSGELLYNLLSILKGDYSGRLEVAYREILRDKDFKIPKQVELDAVCIERNSAFKESYDKMPFNVIEADYRRELEIFTTEYDLILQIFSIYTCLYEDDPTISIDLAGRPSNIGLKKALRQIFQHLKSGGCWIIVLASRAGIYEEFMHRFYHKIHDDIPPPLIPDWNHTIADKLDEALSEYRGDYKTEHEYLNVDIVFRRREKSFLEVVKHILSCYENRAILKLQKQKIKQEIKQFLDNNCKLKGRSLNYRFPMTLDFVMIQKLGKITKP
jgi:HAD superfamily phosphoserine phosphatase-like hydrolase